MIDWTQARVIRVRREADERGLLLVRGPEAAGWGEVLAVRPGVEPCYCMCAGDLTILVQDQAKRLLGELRWHHFDALSAGAGTRPLVDPDRLIRQLVRARVLLVRDGEPEWLPRERWGVPDVVEIRVRAGFWALVNAFALASWQVGYGDRECRVRGDGVVAVLRQDGDEVLISARLGGSPEARFRDTVRRLITD
ncbi:hypothetical protein [Crossiella sp. CA198]|uniref:hypothetical protein n=1 Tax=Crossiella sp. CA198 TaxID=3455607 RepID=UPI003F8D4DF3